MRSVVFIGMVASLAFVSAAESPSNYQSLSGIRADGDSSTARRYDAALSRCRPEALTPPRGTHETGSLRYSAALRACLYRQGYIDRGSFSYPATLVFDHFFGL
ncbi:MAG: hypothetical protein PW791_11080 [Neorhizobium sp.]|nr:hypothetical protein [Neorhizobium sp.]